MDFPNLYIYGDTPDTFSYLRVFNVKNNIAYCGKINVEMHGIHYVFRGYEEFTLNLTKGSKLPDTIKYEELPFTESAKERISKERGVPVFTMKELDSLFKTLREKRGKSNTKFQSLQYERENVTRR